MQAEIKRSAQALVMMSDDEEQVLRSGTPSACRSPTSPARLRGCRRDGRYADMGLDKFIVSDRTLGRDAGERRDRMDRNSSTPWRSTSGIGPAPSRRDDRDVSHLVAAPDKFRGTADAAQVAAAAARGQRRAGWSASKVPLADGGEGLLAAVGGEVRHDEVTGPLGAPVVAEWRLVDPTPAETVPPP